MAIMDSLAAVGAFIGLSKFVKLFICWVQHPFYQSECAQFPFSMRDNFTAYTFVRFYGDSSWEEPLSQYCKNLRVTRSFIQNHTSCFVVQASACLWEDLVYWFTLMLFGMKTAQQS